VDGITDALTITPEAYDHPVAVLLIRELDADLLERYGEGAVLAEAGQFTEARGGRFLLARVDGEPAGCAGVRRETASAAELKRMWVRPAWRRRGIAQALLTGCEDAARELGYADLWLETGTRQPEALALYAAAGYGPVPAFGQWACAPDSIHLGRGLGVGSAQRA
jgi:GNAT superfamily N-acetyltransferase